MTQKKALVDDKTVKRIMGTVFIYSIELNGAVAMAVAPLSRRSNPACWIARGTRFAPNITAFGPSMPMSTGYGGFIVIE